MSIRRPHAEAAGGPPTAAQAAPITAAPDLIIAAGERLFAAHGIEGVSLREIGRAAGQRNVTAVQYHFDGREGLLNAILERHLAAVSVDLHAALDRLEGAGSCSARDVVAALAGPLVGQLDADGGPEFLQIAAQVLNRAARIPSSDRDPLRLLIDDDQGALRRWAQLLSVHMSQLVSGAPLHQRFAVVRFAYLELARRAAAIDRPPGELFAAHLVDLMTALALSVPSPETRRVLIRRTRGQRVE